MTPKISRRAAVGLLLAGAAPIRAEAAPRGDIRVGMTLADIPTATGAPDQGTEGFRFMGYTLYDALINWDLSRADKPAVLRPGLAVSWGVDPKDNHVWTFKLRSGVRFHDGSLFNADAVIWNLDKILDHKAPQYDPAQVAQALYRIPSLATYRKIDDLTVEMTTKTPDATFPYQINGILYSSPAQWEKLGRSWAAFAQHPSGTGPWIAQSLSPRVSAVLRANTDYWDPARIPRAATLTLLPIPDEATRSAALLNNQVNWIESPSPDTVAHLRTAGLQIVTGSMPHSWPYTPSRAPGSPFNDIRVRKALNLAIDRDGLVTLLDGLARPAVAVVEPNSPWFGSPSFKIQYDPAEAKRLLTEAGYGPAHPLKLKFMISTSGSGQMYPLPMNEFVQQNFADVGVQLEFEIMEWNAMRSRRDAGGAEGVANRGIDAINNSWNSMDPLGGFLRHVDSRMTPPTGLNWGFLNDPELDRLCDEARNAFDPPALDAALAKIDTRMVDQAVWLFVVHDVNPRALSPTVHNFVEAQSWYIDFSPIEVTPRA